MSINITIYKISEYFESATLVEKIGSEGEMMPNV